MISYPNIGPISLAHDLGMQHAFTNNVDSKVSISIFCVLLSGYKHPSLHPKPFPLRFLHREKGENPSGDGSGMQAKTHKGVERSQVKCAKQEAKQTTFMHYSSMLLISHAH